MKKRQAAAVIAVVVVALVAVALFMHVFPFNTSPGSGGPNPSTTSPSNTGTSATPSYPRLESLNGTIVSLDGDEITRELWSKMRDYNASDPVVKPYIDWLRNALATDPHKALNVPWYPRYRYWWFNDRYGWNVPAPDTNSVVRVGVVKLPFGAGLIVTAYRTGNGITVVVHGTIINQTGWKELLSRVGAFMGGLKEDAETVKVEWVLWRIMVEGGKTYLAVNDEKIPVKNVIVLLEMPAYTINETIIDTDDHIHRPWYWVEEESAYWDVVGHPALALALHLATPPKAPLISLYTEMTRWITRSTVLTGVIHPGNIPEYKYYTPFLLRMSGRGVCGEQSSGTSLFASNALGAYTGYISISTLLHAISVIMYTGLDDIDTNGDGKPDAVKLVDTAGLSPQYINTHILGVWYEPPLLYADPNFYGLKMASLCPACYYGFMYGYFYSDVAYAVLRLPGWLKAPWLGYAIEKSNFTEIERDAWANTTAYAIRLEHLDTMRDVVEKLMDKPPYLEPPSMALALNKTIGKIPVVYEAETPGLRYSVLVRGTIEVVGHGTYFEGSATLGGDNVTIIIHYKPKGYVEYNVTVYVNGEKAYWKRVYKFLFPPYTITRSTELLIAFVHNGKAYIITAIVKETTSGTGQEAGSGGAGSPSSSGSTGNSSSSSGGGGPASRIINATVRLAPVYISASTPWGWVPVFRDYVGTTMVSQTNVTVVAYPSGSDEYSVNVFINGTRAYGETTGLPATLVFSYDGAEYRLRLETPVPPVINNTVEPELVPVNNVPVPLPNGTVINVTMYKVNETITIGNTTIVIFGFVSRLGIDLDIYVFGVPPGNYTVNITGLEANQTIVEYAGALHVYLHYQAPENQLIPEDTEVKMIVEPLKLSIILMVRG